MEVLILGVVLYSTGCPRCKILEKLLTDKNIDFKIDDNVDELIDKGFQTAPVLKDGDKFMEFGEAFKWVTSR